MSLGAVIGICAAIFGTMIFVVFPEARVLLHGFIGLFIKDMASTPEGAEAIFSEKIDKAQDAYNKADDALKKAAGKLSMAERKMNELQEQLKRIESACETLVKRGTEADMETAMLKAEEREEIVADIQRQERLIVAYREATSTAKEVHQACETNLRKLKKEKNEVVENMKTKKQLKEIYDDTDSLKAATATDKLLETVRDKNRELDEIAEGSRVVHNNRISTKLQKADERIRKAQGSDYLESLKEKYQKPKQIEFQGESSATAQKARQFDFLSK